MQEFDFTKRDGANELSEMAEHLSHEEAALKDFAALTGSKLTIQQDSFHDVTATLTSRCGFDITATQKRMHMVVAAADHISINRWSDSSEVELTLIFGLPENEE